MTLIDRLRRRPRWEHADPAVRAEAVREIGPEEQEVIERLVREDPDAQVRRAALRRVTAPATLAHVAENDSDAGLRHKASEVLVELARAGEAGVADAAAALVTDPRALSALVLSAPLPAVRRAALGRLEDKHLLAKVARTAAEPSLRMEALARLEDPALLAEVASRTDHRDVAMAAVDRLPDGALAEVAAKARCGAASRRAQARLATIGNASASDLSAVPEPASVTPPTPAAAMLDGEAEMASSEARAPSDAPAADEAASPETGVAEGVVAAEDVVASEPSSPAEVPLSGEAPTPDEPAVSDAAGTSSDQAPLADVAMAAEPSSPEAPPEAALSSSAEPADTAAAAEAKEGLRRLDALVVRLETLARSAAPALRDAEAALREARGLQETAGAAPARLARRFKESKAKVFARAQELREAEDWRRWGNATAQEELCRRLEALAAREDLEKVAAELRELDARWAAVKNAPRVEAETLRQRYQAARAPVKARLDTHFARKAQQEAENLQRKQALCERAEALADSTDWMKTAEELKGLQAQWKQVGPTSRRDAEAVWKRFRAACDRFFTRREEDLKQRKKQWTANLGRKEELCQRAEALAGSVDWETAAAEIRKLQAEWKTVGPVRKQKSEAVWQRFRAACDAFFERYKRRDELELAARRAEKEAACAELESLLPGAPAAAEPPADLAAHVHGLHSRLRHGASLPAAEEEALARRFAAARDLLVQAHPDRFRGSDLDPEANRGKKERLLSRVESLAEAQGAASSEALSGEALARRLKEALAMNTIGGTAEAEARRRNEAEEVRAAQAAWKRLGPVPGPDGAALEERFQAACNRFFEQQQPSASRRPRHSVATG